MENEASEAWNRFASTGKIKDYLAFRALTNTEFSAEVNQNANEHRGSHTEGDRRGGE